jgi:hypothetical protein
VFRPCLAPCDRRLPSPKERPRTDRVGSGVSRRSRLGRIPDGPRRGCQWIRPERRSTASVRHPKACGCRRHRDASPKRLVRDPALAPKSGGRWFELLLPVLPQSPAYMMERPLAADAHARRREHLRATRAHPPLPEESMLRRTRHPNPEGFERWASPEAPPGGGPLRTRGSGISSKLERRLRARQSSCSPGRPRLDPKTKSLPRPEGRNDRRRSAVGAVGPHIPPRGGDPSRAPKCPRRDGP